MNSAVASFPRASSRLIVKDYPGLASRLGTRSVVSSRVHTLSHAASYTTGSTKFRNTARSYRSSSCLPYSQRRGLQTDSDLAPLLGIPKRMPEFSLNNRVVLVSGAAQGLGLTQTEGLLEAGAIVYALDRQAEPTPDFFRIQKRAEEELGTKLHYRQVDVRDNKGLNEIVAKIGEDEGRMDGLIAAAGIQQETPALEYTQEDANRLLEINVTGVFMTSQAVAKQMVKFGNGGSIVLIASMSATVANRGLLCPVYNASKAGVVQLARNLAAEWGVPHGIRVNTISPGYIVTSMVEKLFEQFPDRKETWPTQNMLGKLSRPEDYRGAAVFLISDASRFMTGADLRIDGGHCAW